jgi:hypothetical protein
MLFEYEVDSVRPPSIFIPGDSGDVAKDDEEVFSYDFVLAMVLI